MWWGVLNSANLSIVRARLHGVGGQGTVAASRILSAYAFFAGYRAQSTPSFSAEREGSPVAAFSRWAVEEIIERGPVTNPNWIIVQDPALLNAAGIGLFSGAPDGSVAIVNTGNMERGELREKLLNWKEQTIDRGLHGLEVNLWLFLVDASNIAREFMGKAIPNLPLIGALVEKCPDFEFKPEFIRKSVAGILPSLPDEVKRQNVTAAEKGRDAVMGALPLQMTVTYVHSEPRVIVLTPEMEALPATMLENRLGLRSAVTFRIDEEACKGCGLCADACPQGTIFQVEEKPKNYRIDATYCDGCRICVNTCSTHTAVQEQPAGAGLLVVERKKLLFESGASGCRGCPEQVAMRTVLEAAGPDTIVTNATGCSEIISSPYPLSAWRVPWIHSLFENTPAVASGIRAYLDSIGKKEVKVICFGGDGALADISLGTLSGALDRHHKILFVCLDNGAYANTGVQRSGLTPWGASTTTSPAGSASIGNTLAQKDLPAIVAAHRVPYVATASVSLPRDLKKKVKKALETEGPSFIHVLNPCPTVWGFQPSDTMKLGKLAIDTALFPIFEIVNGEVTDVRRIRGGRVPVDDYLSEQRRFRHLGPEEKGVIQSIADANAERFGL